MNTSKIVYTPIPKADRLSKRGWADGWRSEWLGTWVERHAAVQEDTKAEDALMDDLCKQYFVKCHWTIPDADEPPFPLNEWREDVEMPVDNLSDELMVTKRAIVEAKKHAIRRWLRYRNRKVTPSYGGKVKGDATDNPYNVQFAKLSGTVKPGKARQACQEWQVANRDVVVAAIDEAWKKALETGQASGKQDAGFRQDLVRKMFAKLPDNEKKEWAARAKKTAAEAKAKFKEVLTSPPSKDPVVRAKCIAELPNFLQPIAEMIGAVTGLQLVVHAAGPMPQFNGEVSVITVCSGKNLDTPAATVTKWKPQKFARYKEYLEDFVRTCYTDEDLDAAKLPSPAGGAHKTVPADLEYDLSTLPSHRDADDEDSDEDDDDEHDVDVTQYAGRKRKHAGEQGGAKKSKADASTKTSSAKENVSKTVKRAKKSKEVGGGSTSVLGNVVNSAVPISNTGIPPINSTSSSNAAIPPVNPTPSNVSPGNTVPPPIISTPDAESLENEDGINGGAEPPDQGVSSDDDESDSEPAFIAPRRPTYSERRDANIARIHSMPEYQALFGVAKDLQAAMEKPKKPRKPRTPAAKLNVPPRRSGRFSTGHQDVGSSEGPGEDAEQAHQSHHDDKMGDIDGEGGKEAEQGDVEMSEGRGERKDVAKTHASADKEDVGSDMEDVGSDMEDVGADKEDVVMGNTFHSVPLPLEDPEAVEREEEVAEALVAAPIWFTAPYEYFDKAVSSLGPRWRKLLDHYCLLEAVEEFAKKGGDLAADGRPELLSEWIKKGRLTKTSKMPTSLTTASLPRFKRDFTTWYDGLQPDWRRKEGRQWVRPKLGRKRVDWGLLDVRGVCGVLSIVACLYWWGMVTSEMDEQDQEWESAVDDVSWVLEAMKEH